jgi:hypothetical protein
MSNEGKKILTNLEVKGYIDVDGGIKDANSNFGNSGQYLQTSSTDVVWANAPGSQGNTTLVGKYVTTITGTGVDNDANKIRTVQHNLNSLYVVVSVRHPDGGGNTLNLYFDNDSYTHMDVGYSSGSGIEVGTFDGDVTESANYVTLRFPNNLANGAVYLVTIIG